MNQDFLENTVAAISLYCGSNNNPIARQFVDTLKTSIIISGLAFRGLLGTNCKDDNIVLLEDLYSSLSASDSSSFNLSTYQGRVNHSDLSRILSVVEQVGQDIVLLYVLVKWKFASGLCQKFYLKTGISSLT
jgi:hypothetical protein